MSVRVVADFYVRQDAVDEFLAAATALRSETHAKDAGCVAYDLFRDKADPLHLTMIEEWDDHASLDTHLASEHFQRLFPFFQDAGDPDKTGAVTVYEPAL